MKARKFRLCDVLALFDPKSIVVVDGDGHSFKLTVYETLQNIKPEILKLYVKAVRIDIYGNCFVINLENQPEEKK